MKTNHWLMQLSPRDWARQTLDSVRRGWPIPTSIVTLALEISGDIPIQVAGSEEEDYE